MDVQEIQDVLMLAAPSHPCMISHTYEAFGAYAQRLASGYSTQPIYYSVPQHEILDLVRLLLSTVLIKSTSILSPNGVSCRSVYTGSNEFIGAAQALMRRFATTHHNQSNITWQTFKNVIETYMVSCSLAHSHRTV